MFTFKLEEDTTTITVTTKDVYIHEVVDEFRRFLLACGFHPDNIKGEFTRDP